MLLTLAYQTSTLRHCILNISAKCEWNIIYQSCIFEPWEEVTSSTSYGLKGQFAFLVRPPGALLSSANTTFNLKKVIAADSLLFIISLLEPFLLNWDRLVSWSLKQREPLLRDISGTFWWADLQRLWFINQRHGRCRAAPKALAAEDPGGPRPGSGLPPTHEIIPPWVNL